MTITDDPRIYVASLADYNAGRLHGRWIDLDGKTIEEVHEEIEEMLKTSPIPGAEEWEIHDYEGVTRGIYRAGLSAIVAYVTALADMYDDNYREGFAAYVEYVGSNYFAQSPDDVTEEFRDAFLGVWESLGDFAAQYAEDVGLISDMDAFNTAGLVIDWEGTAEGWESDWLASADVPNGVAIWRRV